MKTQHLVFQSIVYIDQSQAKAGFRRIW